MLNVGGSADADVFNGVKYIYVLKPRITIQPDTLYDIECFH